MIWVALTLGTIALIGALICCVSIAVLVSRSLASAFQVLNRMQVQHAEHLDKALDRLMTIDWERFASLQALEDSEQEGGFFPPTEPERESEVEVVTPGQWGSLRALSDEAALLEEDFPDERTAR